MQSNYQTIQRFDMFVKLKVPIIEPHVLYIDAKEKMLHTNVPLIHLHWDQAPCKFVANSSQSFFTRLILVFEVNPSVNKTKNLIA